MRALGETKSNSGTALLAVCGLRSAKGCALLHRNIFRISGRGNAMECLPHVLGMLRARAK